MAKPLDGVAGRAAATGSLGLQMHLVGCPNAQASYYNSVCVLSLSDFPHWFQVTLAVSLGLVFGSFLNVVIYRLPRGESISHPGSRCPACGKPIRAYDNIPVISWVLLRGRARCCGASVSVRYPLVEVLGALTAWAVLEYLVLDLPGDTAWWRALLLFLAYLALGLGMIAAIFIDLEHMLLPDEITLGGTALAFATLPLRHESLTTALIGAAVGFFIVYLPFYHGYRLLRGHPGMGLGDAKLLMMAGAWFGFQGALFALLTGAIQGTVIALSIFAVKGHVEEPEAVKRQREEMRQELEQLDGEAKRELEAELALDPLAKEPEEGLGKARLAFGPFLALATLEYLFFGELIMEQYFAVIVGT